VDRLRKGYPNIIFVISSRNAMQVALMGVLIVSGLPILLGADTPNSVNNQLPRWAVYLWASGLVVFPIVNLACAFIKNVERGLRGEMFSMYGLTVLTMVYPLCVLTFVKDLQAVWVPITLTAGFGVGCLVRALQARKSLREVRALNELLAAQEEAERDES
jgi:hypothetical protein